MVINEEKVNCVNEIERGLKCMDKINMKWWTIFQK